MAEKQLKKFMDERKELKEKPYILPKSKEILSSKKIKPLYKRSNEELAKRFIKMEKLKREIFEETLLKERQEELSLWPKANQPDLMNAEAQKKSVTRSHEQIYEEMQQWAKKKDEAIQEAQLKKIENELRDLKFQPEINQRSSKISSAKKVEK